MIQICGLNKTSLLDYPEHVAATIFTGGCNMRCPFCHNGDLVLHPGEGEIYPEDEVLAFLRKRQGILSGVCITGGEPTLWFDLPVFIGRIKELGYKVKLDTNGTNPDMLAQLIEDERIDYIAMDIKTSPKQYGKVCGNEHLDIEMINKSVAVIMEGKIPYEFRTTVVRQLHDREDFCRIAEWVGGAQAYYLQSYKDADQVLQKGYSAYNREELLEFVNILKKTVKKVELRGVD